MKNNQAPVSPAFCSLMLRRYVVEALMFRIHGETAGNNNSGREVSQ